MNDNVLKNLYFEVSGVRTSGVHFGSKQVSCSEALNLISVLAHRHSHAGALAVL